MLDASCCGDVHVLVAVVFCGLLAVPLWLQGCLCARDDLRCIGQKLNFSDAIHLRLLSDAQS